MQCLWSLLRIPFERSLQVLPSAVDRDTVNHVMQVVLNHDWPVAKAVPSALESVALSLSRVRPPDIGGLER